MHLPKYNAQLSASVYFQMMDNVFSPIISKTHPEIQDKIHRWHKLRDDLKGWVPGDRTGLWKGVSIKVGVDFKDMVKESLAKKTKM